ncbi:sugar-transfer associated ATP-grasp domain-containing protein [Parvimonas sp. D2]|uniref:sugar-transfer associated ATP-grasp domain-containing protein n=1 Tax=unclassified Parvimonas TaxID=1151464 RepID=UPI002B49602D|nr:MULTISPECIES: sugar-transfer associated ATP-grasp domain-containing protein [unclassified Parvimonas]MEB3012765.1 sugar-transfer associated ATP-grasp domain-containing protein [Parvimonas sp. D2]MEB3088204.1 sugar-transfer associated ATP-grasp domain-containing protein [Parvimonas sp. D4]
MRSGVRKKIDDFNFFMESTFRKHKARKSAKLRLKRMNGGYDCTEDYKKIVIPYWEKYGLKPAKMWYQIFWDRSHDLDPRYIPDDLFYGVIVPYFSNPQFRRFGEDKCLHSVWFRDIKRPRTIIMNIASVYYDADFNPITKEEAVDICLKENKFMLKPSIDSGEGRLITFFDENNIKKEIISQAFDDLKANFIAQDFVKQHALLNELNESSLNTVRVISFFFKGKVHILSSILRIGAKGARVDNIGAGGYACVINPDGTLQEKGVNRKAEWIEKTDEGIEFKGRFVPSFDKVIEIVKNEHRKLAHFKLIGWDFSIDESGDPVFIEYNVTPGANQITFGPTFGDLTDEVLEEVFITKTLQYSQN